jgi:ATP-binding cassette, subfamily B, bacterial
LVFLVPEREEVHLLLITILNNLKYSVTTCWKSNKTNVLLVIVIQILNGLLPVTSIYLFQKTIDNLTLFLKNGGSIKLSLIYLLLQILNILLMSTLNQFGQINNAYVNKDISSFVKHIVLEKINRIPFIRFEDPSFNNDLQMIGGVDSKIVNNITQLSLIIKNITTLSSVLAYIINVNILLFLVLLIGIIPFFIIEIRYSNLRYKLSASLISSRREESYVLGLLTNRDSIKELRLFNLHGYFVSKWNNLFKKNTLGQIKQSKSQSIGILITEILSVVTYAVACIYVVFLIGKGIVMIGALIGVIQAIQNIQDSLEQTIKSFAASYENGLYIERFHAFLNERELDSGVYKYSISNIHSIRVENLSFKYPSQNRETLKNISFSIKPRKKIAIVGLNGSGKTTLIKCLMGLYPTNENSIHINNIGLNEVDLESYHKKVSVLFQDFQRFQLTLKENINLGDIENLNDNQKIQMTIQRVGLENLLSELGQGYNSRLGRMFEGGNELSGGQWQKVAIGRSLYRDSDLIIMDEPTSSLDPQAEVTLMEEVFNLYEEKALIYITHRLGATWKADEILVIKNGEIVERGDHNTLINCQGEYFKLYQAQSKFYTKPKEVNLIGTN